MLPPGLSTLGMTVAVDREMISRFNFDEDGSRHAYGKYVLYADHIAKVGAKEVRLQALEAVAKAAQEFEPGLGKHQREFDDNCQCPQCHLSRKLENLRELGEG